MQLKEKYRAVLAVNPAQVKFIHLTGDPQLIAARIATRTDHFMKPEMLASQFAALEPPRDALAVDIAEAPDRLVAQIRRALAV